MRTGKNTKHSKRHLRRWVKMVINFLVCVMIYLASFYAGTGIITLIDYHKNKSSISYVECRDSEVFFQEHIDDFKKWQRREWEKEEVDLEEKLRLCQIACDYELINSGVHKDIEVKAKNLKYPVLGQYCDLPKTIEIDKDFLMNATCTEVFNVIAHEVCHAKQAEEVRAYKSMDPEYQDLSLFADIKTYDFELKHYIEGDEDVSEYAKQKVEITARAQALEREKETFAKIDSITD